jgi:hypothetical protein
MSRRFVAPLVVAAAVAGGGVAGAALGVPVLSGAQETDSTAPTDVPALPDGAMPAPPEGAPRGDGGFAAAAEALGLTVEELFTELRADKTIATVAQEKGVDVNTVIDAMVAKAVEAGRDEAEARERITAFVNEGRGGGAHHLRGRGFGIELDAAAEALGLDRSALVQELRDGKTIAQVAEEQGVDVDTVIDAMVAPVRERITEFVNEGAPARDGEAAPEGDATPSTEGEATPSAEVS